MGIVRTPFYYSMTLNFLGYINTEKFYKHIIFNFDLGENCFIFYFYAIVGLWNCRFETRRCMCGLWWPWSAIWELGWCLTQHQLVTAVSHYYTTRCFLNFYYVCYGIYHELKLAIIGYKKKSRFRYFLICRTVLKS